MISHTQGLRVPRNDIYPARTHFIHSPSRGYEWGELVGWVNPNIPKTRTRTRKLHYFLGLFPCVWCFPLISPSSLVEFLISALFLLYVIEAYERKDRNENHKRKKTRGKEREREKRENNTPSTPLFSNISSLRRLSLCLWLDLLQLGICTKVLILYATVVQ